EDVSLLTYSNDGFSIGPANVFYLREHYALIRAKHFHSLSIMLSVAKNGLSFAIQKHNSFYPRNREYAAKDFFKHGLMSALNRFDRLNRVLPQIAQRICIDDSLHIFFRFARMIRLQQNIRKMIRSFYVAGALLQYISIRECRVIQITKLFQ